MISVPQNQQEQKKYQAALAERQHESPDKRSARIAKYQLKVKNQIGLRRLRLRGLKFVREQFFLAAAAQNIKRLVRFLSQPPTPVLPATA